MQCRTIHSVCYINNEWSWIHAWCKYYFMGQVRYYYRKNTWLWWIAAIFHVDQYRDFMRPKADWSACANPTGWNIATTDLRSVFSLWCYDVCIQMGTVTYFCIILYWSASLSVHSSWLSDLYDLHQSYTCVIRPCLATSCGIYAIMDGI